jgi:hypothetical protein
MNRSQFFSPLLFVCCLTFAAPAAAYDRYSRFTCENYPTEQVNYLPPVYVGVYGGVDTTVVVPPGVSAAISYFRRRDEGSWMVACFSTDQIYWFQFASSSSDRAGPWVLSESAPFSIHGPTYIRVVSDRYHDRIRRGHRIEIHDPWNGVTRDPASWGATFGWYDSAGPGEPNTLIYVCTIRPCPPARLRHRGRR